MRLNKGRRKSWNKEEKRDEVTSIYNRNKGEKGYKTNLGKETKQRRVLRQNKV